MKVIDNNDIKVDYNKYKKIEEFEKEKTKVFKYITYKKRTEQEVRNKFRGQIDENMLEDIIQYLIDANYINDEEFIEKQVREYMCLKTMSITEMKYKLQTKGLSRNIIEKYFSNNSEILEEYEEKCIEKIKEKKSKTMEEKDIIQYLYRKGYKCN